MLFFLIDGKNVAVIGWIYGKLALLRVKLRRV
jgi:hypothetical protein